MQKATFITGVLIILGVIIFDQITKTMTANNIVFGEQIPLIETFLYLTHHRNSGAAWGMFPGQIWFFIIVTVIALGIFLVLSFEMAFKTKPFYSIGVVLLIGGTIGNFIDRLRFGYVIDMVNVYIFSYDFPVFNVADSALTIGWIALAIDIIFINPKRSDDRATKNV